MKRIFVPGTTGMLGSMVAKTIKESIPLTREALDAEDPKYPWWHANDWVINCIGLIKPYCDDVERAVRVNALFPHTFPSAQVLQIATDCVFSGKKGNYSETDLHDALDVYGKTKSLGEAKHIKNLRCSIIGPEVKTHTSLLDWFLSQKEANGFTNHLWNGITTYHFAKICEGILREDIELPNIQHIVPGDQVTKAELLEIIAKAYKKKIPVKRVQAPEAINRTLTTKNPELNLKLWKAAGYDKPPTIEQMVGELSNL